MPKKKEWWQSHFNQNYIKTYIDIATPTKANQQVEFLIKNLKLTKNKKILDLACGYGRHSLLLAEKGYDVTGIDYSDEFIKIANSLKKENNLNNLSFVQGDMRDLKYKNKFDIVINMFTSFGYFKDEIDNLKSLENIYRSLRSGGQFLIDLNNEAGNFERIRQKGRFIKKTGLWEMVLVNKQSNSLVVKTTQKVDVLNHVWYMSREWKENGAKKSYQTRLRTYSFPEIRFLLELVGFKFFRVWGDFNGESLSLKSKRMIILVKK